jgi:RHS repeat-associated protein
LLRLASATVAHPRLRPACGRQARVRHPELQSNGKPKTNQLQRYLPQWYHHPMMVRQRELIEQRMSRKKGWATRPDFYPFGGEIAYTNTCAQNYKFTGKERDSESNLDNFGARYNASQFGRFMSPDSHVPSLTNPQSLNKYTLNFDNPLRWIDRNGQFPTEFHIEISTEALKTFGFGDSGSFVRTVNTFVDRNHFFDGPLHAMSGDNAFLADRRFLLSIAANTGFPGNASESAVALVMGLHLVQDHIAHEGLNGILSHIMRFGRGDDTSKADENAARDATQKFLSDFKALLVANLGDEGAEDALLKIQTAASQLSPTAISGYINELSTSIDAIAASQQNTTGSGAFNPPQSGLSEDTEEMQRQCGLGNPAACN